MLKTETSIVPLAKSQVKQGAEILARAFQNDPMMTYVVGDTGKMLTKPARFYRGNVRMGLLYGEVHTTPDLDAIAVWLRPGKTDFANRQLLRSGLLAGTLSLGRRSMGRFFKAINQFEAAKKQIVSGPYWLLLFIGVEESQRGKGLGAKLLQPMLERADAEKMPIYLDSTNERNLTFYQRHGFEVGVAGQVPDGGPKFWSMIRQPR